MDILRIAHKGTGIKFREKSGRGALLSFSPSGELVNEMSGFVRATRDVLLQDYEIICSHPEEQVVAISTRQPNDEGMKPVWWLECEHCGEHVRARGGYETIPAYPTPPALPRHE